MQKCERQQGCENTCHQKQTRYSINVKPAFRVGANRVSVRMTQLKTAAHCDFSAQAWSVRNRNLEAPACQVHDLGVKLPVKAPPGLSEHQIPRTAQDKIHLVLAGNDVPETPMARLTEVLEDRVSVSAGLGQRTVNASFRCIFLYIYIYISISISIHLSLYLYI